MMDKELSEKINKKLKEAGHLRNLNSKDFRFKTWHASTMNLLKMLPSDFTRDINDFKKLTFTDTKYHRGNKPFSTSDNTKYLEDLDNTVKILEKITSAKKESKSLKTAEVKDKITVKKDIPLKKETISKNKNKKISGNKKTHVAAKKSAEVSGQKPAKKIKTKETAKTGIKEKNTSIKNTAKKISASKNKKSTKTSSK